MKRLFSSLLLLSLVAVAAPRAGAQDYQAPPPQDQGGPGPDQGPPPDQSGYADQGGGDQGNDPGVSYQTFYDNLSDQGTWIQTNDYGYVFQPTVSDPNWAPYSNGHWVYTDQGWTWLSDEPWGWATYHYGRWANIDGEGWVWVPGYRWAPAWVSWRYGGGYCGWAPLPPETFIGVEFGGGRGGFGGFHFGGDVDVSFGIGAGFYNFVPVNRFGDRNLGPVIVNRYNNYTIINRTTNITNVTINRNGAGRDGFRGVNAGGPPLNEINARNGNRFQTMHLAGANGPGRGREQGNAVSFYNPRVNAGTMHQARPSNVARTIERPAFNRGESINRPLMVNSRVRPQAASPELIQKARMAQQQAPASAKIANDRTPVRSSRINGLQPVMQNHQAATANQGMKNRGNVDQGMNANRGNVNQGMNANRGNASAQGNAQDRQADRAAKRHQQMDNQGVQGNSNAGMRNTEMAPAENTGAPRTENGPVHHTQAETAPVNHSQGQPDREMQHAENHTAPVHREREEQARPTQSVHPQGQPAAADRPHAQVQHPAGPAQAHPQAKPQGDGKKDEKKP